MEKITATTMDCLLQDSDPKTSRQKICPPIRQAGGQKQCPPTEKITESSSTWILLFQDYKGYKITKEILQPPSFGGHNVSLEV